MLDFDFGNVIVDSGEFGQGILIEGASSTGTKVAGNFIGTNRSAVPPNLGNGGNGIEVVDAPNNQLGPGNKVWFNDESGVRVSNASGNRIVANSIDANGGAGIELANEANGGLAAPVLSSVTTTSIAGVVDAIAERSYFLEIFSNDSCETAEGRTFVSFVTVEDGAFNEPVTLPAEAQITATLTDSVTIDTSEFSNCREVGAGGDDPPVLFGAVPNAVGSTLGVAGVWDSGSPEPDQEFDISFYSVPSCTPSATKTLLGSRVGLLTNDGGIGAFALAGLTNVTPGTLVTATVEGSEISNCVVADRTTCPGRPRSTWLRIATVTGHLRSSGQARWFKVPILPNSRIDVDLSNLPADYDLVVFKDIQAKYDELIGGAPANQGPNLAIDDLNRQGAETPVDLFNTSQYNPSSWDPTNWKPDLNTSVFSPTEYSPTEYSPTEYSASFTSPTEYSPTEYSPTEYSPTEYSPTEYSPTEYSPTQFSRADWATFNPADPRAFSAAQTASLVAISSGAGTGDESVSVNTWNNTGYFYFRVQGKNGSFNPGTPFSLEVSSQGDLCSGVADQLSQPVHRRDRPEDTHPLRPEPHDARRNAARTKLTTFAQRPEVAGALVNVNDFPTVGS